MRDAEKKLGRAPQGRDPDFFSSLGPAFRCSREFGHERECCDLCGVFHSWACIRFSRRYSSMSLELRTKSPYLSAIFVLMLSIGRHTTDREKYGEKS